MDKSSIFDGAFTGAFTGEFKPLCPPTSISVARRPATVRLHSRLAGATARPVARRDRPVAAYPDTVCLGTVTLGIARPVYPKDDTAPVYCQGCGDKATCLTNGVSTCGPRMCLKARETCCAP